MKAFLRILAVSLLCCLPTVGFAADGFPPELRNPNDLPQHSCRGLAVRMIPLTVSDVVVDDGCE